MKRHNKLHTTYFKDEQLTISWQQAAVFMYNTLFLFSFSWTENLDKADVVSCLATMHGSSKLAVRLHRGHDPYFDLDGNLKAKWSL